MNIVHFGKYYWPEYGGMETALKQIAEAGVALGHQVSCLVAQKFNLHTVQEDISGVHVKRLPTLGKVLSAPVNPFFGEWKKNIDVVHVHLPHPFAELELLKEIPTSTKLLPYFHAYPVRQGKLGLLWFNSVTKNILDRAETVLVSNPSITFAFPQLKPWESKIKVLPFATNIYSEQRHFDVQNKRSKSATVVAVGRLVSYKGFDVLIRAWAKMLKSNAELERFELRIVGDGPERNSLEALIRKFGLSEKVVLVGACDDQSKIKILEDSMLFVAPSINTSETFGISILEAMGFGLPVITTALPTGVSLLARSGECGAVVQPGSEDELALAMASLLADHSRQAAASVSNLEFVKNNYSYSALQKHYEGVLK